MIRLSPNSVARTVKEYTLITFGLFCYAFGWVGVILPAKIVGGGTSGIALLLFYATGGEEGGGIPIQYSILVINAVLILVASFIIGFKFSVKTIYAVVMLSFSMGVLMNWLPPDPIGLADDHLLSAILAGAISGIGISICFSQGGSMGGTDIVAMIINQYRSISYGKVFMWCDLSIIALSYFIGNDLSTVIYSMVVVGVMSTTVDYVMEGNRQSSQVFILSRHYKEISDQISQELHRGVTLLDGVGWYSKQDIVVTMVVCKKSETGTLYRIIRDIDPDAFITVGNVMGVYGEGFESIKKAPGAKKKQARELSRSAAAKL